MRKIIVCSKLSFPPSRQKLAVVMLLWAVCYSPRITALSKLFCVLARLRKKSSASIRIVNWKRTFDTRCYMRYHKIIELVRSLHSTRKKESSSIIVMEWTFDWLCQASPSATWKLPSIRHSVVGMSELSRAFSSCHRFNFSKLSSTSQTSFHLNHIKVFVLVDNKTTLMLLTACY